MILKFLLNIQMICKMFRIQSRKKNIVFDDMIANMISKKNLNPIAGELFIRGRKLNILPVFVNQSCFKVPKDLRLNSTHYFVMKIPKKESFNKLLLIIHQILLLTLQRLRESNGPPLLIYCSSHENHFYTSLVLPHF